MMLEVAKVFGELLLLAFAAGGAWTRLSARADAIDASVASKVELTTATLRGEADAHAAELRSELAALRAAVEQHAGKLRAELNGVGGRVTAGVNKTAELEGRQDEHRKTADRRHDAQAGDNADFRVGIAKLETTVEFLKQQLATHLAREV